MQRAAGVGVCGWFQRKVDQDDGMPREERAAGLGFSTPDEWNFSIFWSSNLHELRKELQKERDKKNYCTTVLFSKLQCRCFGRESVSYSETNWPESFDLIHDKVNQALRNQVQMFKHYPFVRANIDTAWQRSGKWGQTYIPKNMHFTQKGHT